jgi:NAD(P)H-hydrate repair Nnr-like enzyme with NAD(P)H-hydrate epimerase domain
MKRNLLALFIVTAVLSLITIDLPWNMGARTAAACGWGQGGGDGYVPQRRDTDNAYAARPAMTQEQAHQIIEQHVTQLNSTLKVGPVNDTGELFEAEIYSPDNEVVQVLGVDKRSGRLVVIN